MLRKTSHRCHHSKKWGFQQHAEHTRLNSHQNYVLVDAVPLTSPWKLHKPLSPLLTHICHRTHSTRVFMFCVCLCVFVHGSKHTPVSELYRDSSSCSSLMYMSLKGQKRNSWAQQHSCREGNSVVAYSICMGRLKEYCPSPMTSVTFRYSSLEPL